MSKGRKVKRRMISLVMSHRSVRFDYFLIVHPNHNTYLLVDKVVPIERTGSINRSNFSAFVNESPTINKIFEQQKRSQQQRQEENRKRELLQTIARLEAESENVIEENETKEDTHEVKIGFKLNEKAAVEKNDADFSRVIEQDDWAIEDIIKYQRGWAAKFQWNPPIWVRRLLAVIFFLLYTVSAAKMKKDV